ncbi:hypothetical protein [Streptomyces sp. NPDC059063]|uniref:hypothetical protein n=1 Tax=unclassified Streptomyces TaxID=2593676 RepID=UPI0036C42279
MNMKYLAKQDHHKDAALLFARFGLLQMTLAQIRRLSHEKEKGRSARRKPVAEALAALGTGLHIILREHEGRLGEVGVELVPQDDSPASR